MFDDVAMKYGFFNKTETSVIGYLMFEFIIEYRGFYYPSHSGDHHNPLRECLWKRINLLNLAGLLGMNY